MRSRLAFIILLVAAAAGGCSRHPAPSGQAGAPTAGPRPTPQTLGALRPLTLGPVARQGGALPQASLFVAAASLAGDAALLALSAPAPVLPTDFVIGPLEPEGRPQAESSRVAAVISAFFAALAKGKVEVGVISQDQREILLHVLDGPIADKDIPRSVRIGAITIDGGEAHARIRMMSGVGRTDGAVYLDLVKKSWQISDIQADFGALSREYKRTSLYEPSTWQWMLND